MQLLRASSRHAGEGYDLSAINGAVESDTGIKHAALLVAFAEAVIGDDDAALRAARDALGATLGAAALVDAAAVVGLFNAIDRVADATGILIEDDKAEDTADMRASLGIDGFQSMRNV